MTFRRVPPHTGSYGSSDFASGSEGADDGFWLEFPEFWSVEAVELFVERCLVRSGIPVRLSPVPESDVPRWLWRRSANGQTEASQESGETGVCAAIDRVAGAWAYDGWKGGYFDSESDARVFFDEIRWLLIHRRISPELAVWRHAGVFRAYGLEETDSAGFVTDYRTGAVRRATEADMPPHGAVINGLDGSLDGDGGVWELFRRESALRDAGCSLGVNGSALTMGGRRQKGSLVSLLRLGEASMLSDGAGPSRRSGTRRTTVDAEHPGAAAAIRHMASAEFATEAGNGGRVLALRHVKAIMEACAGSIDREPCNPLRNPALRFALQAARGAIVPEALVGRVLSLIRSGTPFAAEDLVGGDRPIARTDPSTVVLRADDTVLDRAVAGHRYHEQLLSTTALACWTSGRCGIHFATTAEAWNTCPEGGLLATAAGDGDFLFLDDTTCSRALLNVAAFIDADGVFRSEDLCHATDLLTVALDIGHASGVAPTPRQARRNWDYRPIAISPAGLSVLPMAHGIAYDSARGRRLMASVAGLVTGAAYRMSAALAEELGNFPAWQRNSDAMLRVLRNHADAARRGAEECDPAGLDGLLGQMWDDVPARGDRYGFRNAQVSLVAAMDEESELLDCPARGLEPLFTLLRYERLPGGGFGRSVDASVLQGLRALGYDGEAIHRIVQHACGHETLAGSPGINHANLRQRGFTEAAIATIEEVVGDVPDITLAFGAWVLGDDFCREMLRIDPEECATDGRKILHRLGYSDAAIEAANSFCCGTGTLEGAAALAPDHFAVFDCATEQGVCSERRVSAEAVLRAAAAVQPLVSGGIGHRLRLPSDTKVADCRDFLLLAWRLGLKSIVLAPENAEGVTEQIAARDDFTPFLVWNAGAVAAPAEAAPEAPAHTNIAGGPEERGVHDATPGSAPETVIAKKFAADAAATRDARASHRPVSDRVRSAASVPSSPDAAVEQRQV